MEYLQQTGVELPSQQPAPVVTPESVEEPAS